MNGVDFVNAIESLLEERHIPKTDFYKYSGITSASVAQWRVGKYDPSNRAIEKVENFFNIKFIGGGPEYKELGEQKPYKGLSVPDEETLRQTIAMYLGKIRDYEEKKYVAVPIDSLAALREVIDESSEELSSIPKMFNAANATEPQWREQLEKCNIEQLFSIQKTLTDVIQEKAIKNAKPE